MKKFLWNFITVVLLIISVIWMVILVMFFSKLTNKINKYHEIAKTNDVVENDISNNDVIAASYLGIKVSPNAKIVYKVLHKKCGDISVKEEVAGEEIVNKNELEISEIYNDWEIKKFSSNEIILYKEEDSVCGEDYYIRDLNGTVCVMKVDNSGQECLYRNTEIEIQYLPKEDRVRLQNGIKIKGMENVNKILEDFE